MPTTAGVPSPPEGAPGFCVAASTIAAASAEGDSSSSPPPPPPSLVLPPPAGSLDAGSAGPAPACAFEPCSAPPPPGATIPAPNRGAAVPGAALLPPPLDGSACRRALSNGIAYSLPVGEPGSTKTPSCASAGPARPTSDARSERGTWPVSRRSCGAQRGRSACRSIQGGARVLGEREQRRVERIE